MWTCLSEFMGHNSWRDNIGTFCLLIVQYVIAWFFLIEMLSFATFLFYFLPWNFKCHPWFHVEFVRHLKFSPLFCDHFSPKNAVDLYHFDLQLVFLVTWVLHILIWNWWEINVNMLLVNFFVSTMLKFVRNLKLKSSLNKRLFFLIGTPNA